MNLKRFGRYIILDEDQAKEFLATALRWALSEYHTQDDAYWDRVEREDNPGAFNVDIFMGALWFDILKGEGYEKFLRFLEPPS